MRFGAILAVVMMAWVVGPVSRAAADPRPSTATSESDSVRTPTPSVPTVQDVRDAYENAYLQRQAGAFVAGFRRARGPAQSLLQNQPRHLAMPSSASGAANISRKPTHAPHGS